MPITLSIVTPTYNQDAYIGQTIESILSQEGDFYIDYLIINDGSTDTTLSIIEKYDRILKNKLWPVKCLGISYRYVTRKNGGQTSAINMGLRMAQGYACAWMNSDDYYMPGAFSEVSQAFENKPNIDFIYTDCLKVYNNGRAPSIDPRPRNDENFESLRTRGNSFALNFFTKKILDKVGYLDESLQYCMDLDLWFRIFKLSKAMYLPYTVGAFRIWEKSKTSMSQNKFTAERKIIAKRYGGNLIPAKKIYLIRGRIKLLDIFKRHMPGLYENLKRLFYSCIDIFTYKR